MAESSDEKCRKEVEKTVSQTQSAPPGSAGQPVQQNPQNPPAPSGPMRPRSLYTAHTAYHDEPNNFTRYGEFPKYLEPADQWMGMGGGGAAFPLTPGIWRQPRNPKPTSAPYYASEEGLYAGDNWRDHQQHDNEIVAVAGGGGTCGGAIATPHGTISLRLHNRIRVDMTIDRAVRVINFKNNIVLSLSGSGAAAALLHPNGRIYQYGSRVEILAHDAHGNNKY